MHHNKLEIIEANILWGYEHMKDTSSLATLCKLENIHYGRSREKWLYLNGSLLFVSGITYPSQMVMLLLQLTSLGTAVTEGQPTSVIGWGGGMKTMHSITPGSVE